MKLCVRIRILVSKFDQSVYSGFEINLEYVANYLSKVAVLL